MSNDDLLLKICNSYFFKGNFHSLYDHIKILSPRQGFLSSGTIWKIDKEKSILIESTFPLQRFPH